MRLASLIHCIVLGAALSGTCSAVLVLPPALPAYASSATTGRLTDFQSELDDLAQRARPGTLGVLVLDLETGKNWGVNEERAFPMMSVFKAPLAATVLAMADDGKLSLQQTITLTRVDLRAGASRIAKNFEGNSMTFSIEQLLEDAVSYSDNTAADALMKLAGGPETVTHFLRAHGIEGMRVDLDERGVEHVFSGLGSASEPPKNETAKDRTARLWQGYLAFLDDPRNRSTPTAAVDFLQKLWNGKLLSVSSTQHLLDLLYGQTVPIRLRAGIPTNIRVADKCGTSVSLRGVTAAFNDIGILTWPDGHTAIIAAFLTASHASKNEREEIFADLARETVKALRP